jgi:hypothetical protein
MNGYLGLNEGQEVLALAVGKRVPVVVSVQVGMRWVVVNSHFREISREGLHLAPLYPSRLIVGDETAGARAIVGFRNDDHRYLFGTHFAGPTCRDDPEAKAPRTPIVATPTRLQGIRRDGAAASDLAGRLRFDVVFWIGDEASEPEVWSPFGGPWWGLASCSFGIDGLKVSVDPEVITVVGEGDPVGARFISPAGADPTDYSTTCLRAEPPEQPGRSGMLIFDMVNLPGSDAGLQIIRKLTAAAPEVV